MSSEENYHIILEKVSNISKIDRDELERRVEAKRAKLSGLISREGALQIIAAELNISFDNEKLKINEILPGMRKVNFSGKVITLYPIREYTTKSGDKGKVANMIIADDTSNIKVVLWDTNHIALLESGEICEGKCIEIKAGGMRDTEVHLGGFSELKVSDELFLDVKTEKQIKYKSIEEFSPGENVVVRAFVVQAFDLRFFDVSANTGKKVTEEELAEGVPTEKRAILNLTIDDGTENMRAVLFHENVQKIGLKDFDNPENLLKQKENILGNEFIFQGVVKRNSYFNNYELGVNDVSVVDLDKLIEELEK